MTDSPMTGRQDRGRRASLACASNLDLVAAFGDAIAWLGHPVHTHV